MCRVASELQSEWHVVSYMLFPSRGCDNSRKLARQDRSRSPSQPYRYRLGSLLLTPLNGPGERLVRSISPVLAQNATNKPVAMSRSWNRSRTAPFQNPLPFVATADLLSTPVPCRTGNAHPLCRRLGAPSTGSA